MYSQEQIFEFIKARSGIDLLSIDDDLLNDLGISGDDFHELIAEYQKEFNVDMAGYLWYFHSDEEGNNIGGAFFSPPYERVNHIPVTPSKLLEFANKGHWDIKYPEHTLPKYRLDIIINIVLIIVFLSWVLYSCLK
jgi:hypothetical protein